MAWSVVQSKGKANASAATTIVVTLTSTPTTGNKLIAAIAKVGNGTAPSSVKDSNNNSLTLLANANNGNTDLTLLYAYDVPATPSTTITCTFSTTQDASMVVQEVSGLLAGNTTAMCDGTVATKTGTYTGNGSTTTPTYSSTAANEYLVTVYGDFGNSATMGTPTGYTLDGQGINTNANCDCLVAYKNSTNGAESAVWTATSNSGTNDYAVVLGAFKVAAGGGSPVPMVAPVVSQAVNRSLTY